MSERAITLRVETLGETVGITGLSAHDCRHYWATTAARHKTDPFALQEAGGWTNDFFAGDALENGNPVLACAPGLREALVSITGVGQATEKLERRIS